MSSITEHASTDLKSARLLLHKIGTTFTNFQSHTLAIFSLGEEWKILQTSFAKAHKSLEDRVKEMESNEREISSQKNQLRFALKEIELRKSKLAFEEKSLSERVNFVEIREKQVKEWFESLELEKSIVDERRKAVEVAEKRFSEGFERVEAVEGRENELAKRKVAVCEKEKELKVFHEGLRLKEGELKTKEAILEENRKELELKEKELNEGLKLKESELKTKEAALEENRKELGLKENELNEGLKLKENELKTKEATLEENRKDLGLKEKELNELYEGLKVKEGEVNARVMALEQKEVKYLEDRKLVDELFDVLHLNEKDVDDKSEKLAVQEEELESRCREVEAKEKELNERLEELKAKEKQINDSCDVLESQGKKVDDQCKRLELKEKEIDELRQTIAIKEKKLNEGLEATFDLKRKRVVERCEEVDPKAKQAKKMANVKNYKYRKAGKKIKESKDKQMNEHSMLSRRHSKDLREETRSVSWSGEQPSPSIGQVSCTVDSLPSNTCDKLHSMCKSTDALGVRSYLMERVQEQKTLHEKMFDALRCAPDPAKFALNVFRNFHQKFNEKCQSRANKTSCIFVLEQLMKLSPPITYEVKMDAKKFAELFRDILERSNSATDSFGFLLLLATFKLSNFYSADDLLFLFNVYYGSGDIYRLEENSYLCNALGLLDKIPGFVRSLIVRKKRLSAIKYICVFKLEHDFPLKPLLEGHLTYIKDRVRDRTHRRKNGTFKSKSEAIKANSMELYALNDLIKHIKVFNLELIYPIGSLLSRVNELEKEARKPNVVAPLKKHNADLGASVSSAPIPIQLEKLPNVFAPVEQPNADSCASAVSSVAMSNQLEKRPRVGDVPQVAPLDIAAPCPPPMPYTLGHATHVNPNLPGTVPASNGFGHGVGPHHMGPAPFVPPGVYPFGPPRPFC